MVLLYPYKTMYFFRIHYKEDNFIYQSRGFDGLRNLKISLTSFMKWNNYLNIEILTLNPKTNELIIHNTGNNKQIQDMLYNGREIGKIE